MLKTHEYRGEIVCVYEFRGTTKNIMGWDVPWIIPSAKPIDATCSPETVSSMALKSPKKFARSITVYKFFGPFQSKICILNSTFIFSAHLIKRNIVFFFFCAYAREVNEAILLRGVKM